MPLNTAAEPQEAPAEGPIRIEASWAAPSVREPRPPTNDEWDPHWFNNHESRKAVERRKVFERFVQGMLDGSADGDRRAEEASDESKPRELTGEGKVGARGACGAEKS